MTHGRAHPKRGAVAAAVKRFLALHGIEVRTRVEAGAWVTAIDLRAPESRSWTEAERAFMEEALGLTVRGAGTDASFEPWRTLPEDTGPHADYAGKGGGLRIAPEHVPAFAPLLASALKEAGQDLNRLGNAWLIRGVQQARTKDLQEAEIPSGAAAGGPSVTPDSESPVEGCRELQFHLSGYGQIRVVCGAHGRRDTWNNIFIGRNRYGWNGARWSKGQVPPAAVLNAVAERGITIFGGRRVTGHAEDIRYL